MQLTGSKEYSAFLKGMKTFQAAEAKLAAWHYLVPLYVKNSSKQQQFTKELEFVSNSFPRYIKALPDTLFTRQYLLTKGLIEQMPKSTTTYKWRAPAHVLEFMAIDFKALKHAGLYTDIIEGYTNLVERFSLEEVYFSLNQAIDKVVSELKDEPTLLQEITQQWFLLLEQKSLFTAAEYLALTMLNQDDFALDTKSKNMFEQYRALAVGKIAPNINLGKNKTLKKLKNSYKLVVFGASWCPACQKDTSELLKQHSSWKAKNVEIIYISIDTDKTAFDTAYKNVPWQTYCDYRGWETQAAKDYYISGTPSYFLLDATNKILVRPNSVAHANSWIESKVTNK